MRPLRATCRRARCEDRHAIGLDRANPRSDIATHSDPLTHPEPNADARSCHAYPRPRNAIIDAGAQLRG